MDLLKKIYISATALLVSGCYEDFTPCISSNDEADKLCLNALVVPGQPIEANVSHTWRFNDPSGEYAHGVDDAHISLIVNGERIDNPYIPSIGDSVIIIADSQRYGHAEGSTVIPSSPEISKIEAKFAGIDAYFAEYGEYLYVDIDFGMEVMLTLHDPSGTENFYELCTSSYPYPDDSPERFYPGKIEYEAEPIFSEHIGVFETMMGIEPSSFTFFTDKQIDGQDYTLKLRYSGGFFQGTFHNGIPESYSVDFNIILKAISPSYYRWAAYQWHITEGLTGDLSNIGLADPLWGYSNVSTGAGVIAAETSTKVTLRLTGRWWETKSISVNNL